eukprot:CAMPEP_0175054612 /NCGR_PEP_ID=MMETSP0052_2-20121109/9599_1 /TAXON_ID=51329 ORGANISM="Polytomella parva, Strain SAG 63-3" /NCGR_SAMPLE_ID=MMETSP0052_2 /ASSEMBLY_ACC=CAM_ASM_000194 /LENGTH=263 /DNA_ID=CAMNT_0016319321 /DNA_START=1 /DNA_END=792 /DNA_ORIENTATION=+
MQSLLEFSTPDVTKLIGTSARMYSTVVPASAKRFYKNVGVEKVSDNKFLILLDKHIAKTPAKQDLCLPNRSLALAVAAEWEWQKTSKPQLHSMPLTSLAASAIDVPRERDKMVEHTLKYIHTDSSCCRYERGPIRRRQDAVFDPILSAVQLDLGWKLDTSDAIMGPHQPEETVEKVRSWLEGLDPWRLEAVQQLTATCKSLVLAAALVKGIISPEEAMSASRIEEEAQAEEWGKVEAGHDLDEADISTRIYAPSIFIRLLERG